MSDMAGAVFLSKDDVARSWGVSLPTVDKWLGDIKSRLASDQGWAGCPVVTWGGNGKAYEIDADKLRLWRDSVADAERRAEEARRSHIDAVQRTLDLEGGDVSGEAKLPMAVRKEMAGTILAEARAMRERGQLVDAKTVQAEFERVFQYLASQLQGLADHLQRECDLPAVAAALIHERTLEWQGELARKLMKSDDERHGTNPAAVHRGSD
ncbi:MAG: hypothetical protein HQL35_14820 [Alphaproteobacteria bacterium]|nr:hypothetical protein [Alphaproteobacteria bacterium]